MTNGPSVKEQLLEKANNAVANRSTACLSDCSIGQEAP